MRVDEYRERYGLDKPLLTQYWLWISNFVQGDFGLSFEYERPVRELIGQRLTLSIMLSLTHAYNYLGDRHPGGGLFGGQPVFDWRSNCHNHGLYRHRNTGIPFRPDCFVCGHRHSRPGCGRAVLTRVQGCALEPGQSLGPDEAHVGASPDRRGYRHSGDHPHHARQPAGHLRPGLHRSRPGRGLKHRTVVWKHAVRMAITPLIIILGTEAFPAILSGNILVEVVLGLPTIGPLYIHALTHPRYVHGWYSFGADRMLVTDRQPGHRPGHRLDRSARPA